MQAQSRRTRFVLVAIAIIGLIVIGVAVVQGASSRLSGSTGTSSSSTSSTSSPTTSSSGVTLTTSSTRTTDDTATSTTSTDSTSASTTGDWLTYHGSNTRDGYDTTLPSVSSVSTAWKSTVDGDVYAEPVSFDGSIFIVTENDTVYSLSASTGAIQWSQHVANPANSTVAPYACNGGSPTITPLIGITSTPVIDPSTSTLYTVALDSGVQYTLFAINTNNGQIRWSTPIEASGFAYLHEEQRGALTLANGMIYIPFGSFSWSCGSPTGWLFAISANGNGTQYSFQVDTQSEGDIWTPEGVSVDSSGYVYAVTGNSYYNATYNYADSVLKFTPQLKLVSYFAPTNWAFIGPADLDQDTTGATLLSNNMLFSIGKSGVGFLLNESDLGGIGGQVFTANVCSAGAWGSTTYANGVVYIPCANGLYAVSLSSDDTQFTPLWNSGSMFAGPAIVTGGAVWSVDIANGTLFLFNPTTGAEVTSLALGPVEHFTTPSIGGGYVIIAAMDTVYAINP